MFWVDVDRDLAKYYRDLPEVIRDDHRIFYFCFSSNSFTFSCTNFITSVDVLIVQSIASFMPVAGSCLAISLISFAVSKIFTFPPLLLVLPPNNIPFTHAFATAFTETGGRNATLINPGGSISATFSISINDNNWSIIEPYTSLTRGGINPNESPPYIFWYIVWHLHLHLH